MYPIDSMIYVSPDGGPLGKRAELLERLATINTVPSRAGAKVLHGPGIRVIFTPEEGDDITQVEVSSTGPLEREIAELSFERIENTFPSWVRSFDPAGNEVSEDTEEFFQIDEFLDD